MDHIDEVLATQSQDPSFEPCIRAALGIAKKTLNSYYTKTDQSDVYRIAMGKFQYDIPYYNYITLQSSTPVIS